MTTTTTTITEISNSSDALWEAVCLFEDGEGEKADAIWATLNAADRRIFAEECDDIRRKRREKARANAPKRPAFRFYGCDAAADDYEGRILDRQDVWVHGPIA